MKVIEKKEWNYTFTCRGCKSTLETQPEDVKKASFGVYDDFETEYYVTCPECLTENTIPKSKIWPSTTYGESKGCSSFD